MELPTEPSPRTRRIRRPRPLPRGPRGRGGLPYPASELTPTRAGAEPGPWPPPRPSTRRAFTTPRATWPRLNSAEPSRSAGRTCCAARSRLAARSATGAGLPSLLESGPAKPPAVRPPKLARRTYRDAIYAALTAGRLAYGRGPRRRRGRAERCRLTTPTARTSTLLTGLRRGWSPSGYAVERSARPRRRAGASGRTAARHCRDALPGCVVLPHGPQRAWDFAPPRLVRALRAWSTWPGRTERSPCLPLRPPAAVVEPRSQGDLRAGDSLLVEAEAIGEARQLLLRSPRSTRRGPFKGRGRR